MSGWEGHELSAAGGTRMHAALLGPPGAPEVVCVHGLGCSHRYFLPLARRLAPAARVAAVDLPGFGRSRGPAEPLDMRGLSMALADWLRRTGRDGSVLLGNSNGCQVIVDLAVHAPEVLGPVVLQGPTVDPRARRVLLQAGRLLMVGFVERPDLALVLARDYAQCGPRRYFATLRHMLSDPIERKLGLVDVPAVVVRGRLDRVVPHEWAAEVAALLPQGRLVEVPGRGHALNYSAPDRLADVARSLLDAPFRRP